MNDKEIVDKLSMDKIVDDVHEYANFDNSEIGETRLALINLWYKQEYLCDDFLVALYNEIEKTYKDYTENYSLIETEETYTVKTKELVYLEE